MTGSRFGLRRRRLSQILLLTLIVGVINIGGFALAYWRGGGGGTGSGPTGTVTAVTMSPGTPVAGLYPGGQSNVALVMSNPNAGAVSIGSLSLDGTRGTSGFAVDTDHSGCDVSTLTYTTQTNADNGWIIPAGTDSGPGTLPVTLTDAVSMGLDAANACQGATFTVYLTAAP